MGFGCRYFDICDYKYMDGTEHLENPDYLECPTFPSSETCKYYKEFEENKLGGIVDESKPLL